MGDVEVMLDPDWVGVALPSNDAELRFLDARQEVVDNEDDAAGTQVLVIS